MVELFDYWTCHVCKEERLDRFISVYSKDISKAFGFEEGVFKQNVRYCNDREYCTEQAKSLDLVQPKRKE